MTTQKLVTEKVVSEITGLALSTLRNARFRGEGIPYYVLMSRAVRYDMKDVEEYIAGRRINTERQP